MLGGEHGSRNGAGHEGDEMRPGVAAPPEDIADAFTALHDLLDEHGLDDPEVALSLIESFQSDLEALQKVLRRRAERKARERGGSPPAAPPAFTPAAGHSPGSVASHGTREAEATSGGALGNFDGEIGRNQKSKVRELIVLSLLESKERSFSLKEVLNELNAHGMNPTNSAVVSQLHRLKGQDLVSVSGSGTYSFKADKASAYLRSLRRDFESLKPPRRA